MQYTQPNNDHCDCGFPTAQSEPTSSGLARKIPSLHASEQGLLRWRRCMETLLFCARTATSTLQGIARQERGVT